VSAVKTVPDGAARLTFVYAPGAGSNIDDPFGRYLTPRLAAAGIATVRFQFPYMEAGRKGPDRPATLEETWRRVIDAVRPDTGKLAIGGRSMGGRIGSNVAAQGTPVDALALFAYPLHAPSKSSLARSAWRDGHLPKIAAPTFFASGTRDTFATPEELREAAGKVPNSTVHILEGADHGFAVLKSSGRIREDVWDEAIAAMLEWLAAAC